MDIIINLFFLIDNKQRNYKNNLQMKYYFCSFTRDNTQEHDSPMELSACFFPFAFSFSGFFY